MAFSLACARDALRVLLNITVESSTFAKVLHCDYYLYLLLNFKHINCRTGILQTIFSGSSNTVSDLPGPYTILINIVTYSSDIINPANYNEDFREV
jgi:hypothetical protein